MTVAIRVYREADFAEVRTLWQQVFPDDPPWNRAEEAVPAKLAIQPDLFLVASDGANVIGTIMAGYDGHRGWLYAVAVSESHRRAGVGSALVREAEIRLAALGCRKVNLQIRATNIQVQAFYDRLGYGTEDRISMGKRLSG
jgi:ribosomal protein S18 acetylase RimI-like enzyme